MELEKYVIFFWNSVKPKKNIREIFKFFRFTRDIPLVLLYYFTEFCKKEVFLRMPAWRLSIRRYFSAFCPPVLL